jgi:hypothetical protein
MVQPSGSLHPKPGYSQAISYSSFRRYLNSTTKHGIGNAAANQQRVPTEPAHVWLTNQMGRPNQDDAFRALTWVYHQYRLRIGHLGRWGNAASLPD